LEWINLAQDESKAADFCKQGSKHPGSIQFGDIACPEDDLVLAEEGICSIMLASEVL